MTIIKNLKEMKKYYDKDSGAYIFIGVVEFEFNVCVDKDIKVMYGNIHALHITARNIEALNIRSHNITARNITAWDINAHNITAQDIMALDIDAWDIDACEIYAWDIKAHNIKAKNISYFAVCCAYENITCETIEGSRKNAKHFCLDGGMKNESSND